MTDSQKTMGWVVQEKLQKFVKTHYSICFCFKYLGQWKHKVCYSYGKSKDLKSVNTK